MFLGASAVYPTASLVCAGTSTPPSIAATPVPALPPPIAVNSYASVPAPPSGQSATDALYSNGVHAYQGTTEQILVSSPVTGFAFVLQQCQPV